MPLRLSDLASFIPPVTAPRYHGGLSRAADTINQVRAADQRDQQLALQEQELEAQQAQRVIENERANAQLGINRGYLDLQTEQETTKRALQQRQLEQAAIADFVDSLSPTADPMRRELAQERLRALGLAADAPTVGQVATAAAAPIAQPAPAVEPTPGAVAPPAAPAGPERLEYSGGETGFDWISPIRPSPARFDVIPQELPTDPQQIQQAPLAQLAPSAPSARQLATPEQAALAGGAAGLSRRPITMGAVDATRALPSPGMGVPPAAPGLPPQGAGTAQSPPSAPVQPGSEPLGGAGIPPVAPPIPTEPPTPEIAAWRIRRGDDVLMELDPAEGAQLRQKMIAEAFAPLVASARTEEERRAAGLAMDTAKRATDAGEPTKNAIEEGRKAYEFEIREANALKRAGISAAGRMNAAQAAANYGATGLAKDEYNVRSDLTQHVDKVIQQVSGQRKVAAVNDTALEFDKLLALSNEKTGFADSNAVVSFITALQQRATDADYRTAIGSGGVLAQIDSFVQRYDPRKQGQLSADYMRQVKSAAESLRQAITQEKLKIAAQAERAMRSRATILRLGPEDTEAAVDMARTQFEPEGYVRPRPQQQQPRAPQSPQHSAAPRQAPAAPAARSKSVDINERARRLGL